MFIFECGVYAGLMGEDPRCCPYDKMTKEWKEWLRGHRWGVDYIELLHNGEFIDESS